MNTKKVRSVKAQPGVSGEAIYVNNNDKELYDFFNLISRREIDIGPTRVENFNMSIFELPFGVSTDEDILIKNVLEKLHAEVINWR